VYNTQRHSLLGWVRKLTSRSCIMVELSSLASMVSTQVENSKSVDFMQMYSCEWFLAPLNTTPPALPPTSGAMKCYSSACRQRASRPHSSKCAALALDARRTPTSPSPPPSHSRSPSLSTRPLAVRAPGHGSAQGSKPYFQANSNRKFTADEAMEAPFKLHFIGCTPTLPKREGILC
jgi:hypothetical protein